MRTRRSVDIPRDAASVFGYLSRVENEVQWRESIVESRYRHASEPAVGVRGETHVEMGGRGVVMRWDISEFEPETLVAWTLDGSPWNGGGSYRVVPTDSGCRLTASLEVRLHGVMRVLEPILWLNFSRGLRGDLASVQELLSGSPRR
ncbi:MAG: SRPBCC family protein [Salinibacterium sp.]|nr:SRPBCC family protein [Salinibacterium sp.]MBF0671712.1 SRPBCC family protein [Salinibacterium sp.]